MTAVMGLSDSGAAGEKVLILYPSLNLLDIFIHGYLKRQSERAIRDTF